MTDEDRARVGARLLAFHRLYSEKITRPMLEAHRKDLTQMEFFVLSVIAGSDGIATTSLAERARMPKQQLTRVVNELEDGGYVSRARGGADRRVVRLWLTDLAKEKLAQYATAMAWETLSSLAAFSAPEQAEFEACLERLAKLLEKFPAVKGET